MWSVCNGFGIVVGNKSLSSNLVMFGCKFLVLQKILTCGFVAYSDLNQVSLASRVPFFFF